MAQRTISKPSVRPLGLGDLVNRGHSKDVCDAFLSSAVAIKENTDVHIYSWKQLLHFFCDPVFNGDNEKVPQKWRIFNSTGWRDAEIPRLAPTQHNAVYYEIVGEGVLPLLLALLTDERSRAVLLNVPSPHSGYLSFMQQRLELLANSTRAPAQVRRMSTECMHLLTAPRLQTGAHVVSHHQHPSAPRAQWTDSHSA